MIVGFKDAPESDETTVQYVRRMHIKCGYIFA